MIDVLREGQAAGTLTVTASWRTLFQLAHELGQAKLRMIERPTEENAAAFEEAQRRHDEYRDICLIADKMLEPLPIH